MKWAGTYSRARWHSNTYVRILPPSIMNLGQVIYNLIESHRNKIGELHLNHAFKSFKTQPQRGPQNGTFAKRSVSYSFLSKFFNKSFCYFKHSSIFRNVLSHQHQVGMMVH